MGSAAAQSVMRINMSIAKDSHQGVAIDQFAKEVNERTGGRYKFEIFYAGSLGGERESIEPVQLGTQALTFSSTGPVPNFVPEARILDIPFLFRDKAHARAVLDGPIGQDMSKEFESKGLKVLAWCDNGIRHMTNSKRDVNVPDDLKGLKMRTLENPVHVAAFKSLGIVPTPMAFPEVFTALQQGTVDVQENPLSVIMAAKFDQVQKHVSLVGACAMLVIAASLGLFQVFMRFVLEAPAEWTEVLIRFSLVWMVFLGIAPALRQGAMVSVDMAWRRSGPAGRRILNAIAALAALTLVGIIIWWGWDYANRGSVQSVIGLEGVTMFWAYLALPVGGCFAALGIIGNFLDPKRLELETAL